MYGNPKDVIELTGITPSDFGLDDDDTQGLNNLLTIWIERISSAIDVRLDGTIKTSDFKYKGIVDVCIRHVAKLIAVARQQRISPVVQIGDYALSIINTSQVIKDLDDELKPYKRKSVGFYSSNKF